MVALPIRMRSRSSLRLNLTAALALMGAIACSPDKGQTSKPLVTDVEHSLVKNQAIGNCWLYAAAGWAESLHLAATGEETDLSESYWTWWYFYDQLLAEPSLTVLKTGGWWSTSNGLIAKHGYLLEGEFIAEESDVTRSQRQKAALAYLNEQLKVDGALATPESRTEANVRAQLDKAFGTDMAASESLARPATSYEVGKQANGTTITLADVTSGSGTLSWRQFTYPKVTGEGAVATASIEADRKALLKRAMRALNDRQPVVVTLMVDFNAWDRPSGTFNLETLATAGAGNQGGHMLVLEDYAVDNVPGIGSIEEGDVSDELKALALDGDLRHLVVKNSWSESVTGGYHRFTRSYLDATLGWKKASGGIDHYTTLGTLLLPPGY